MGLQERFFRAEQNIQLSYELQHRINAVVSYPVLSPNGSRITLYAHDSGLRILWRGGRSFKPATKATSNGKQIDNDSIMIIDSDDDETAAGASAAEFNDEEDEVDPQKPFPPIMQFVDLSFGTAATALAISTAATDKIIFAATCADSTVRLGTIPITPPSPEHKAQPAKAGKYGETIQTLTGFSTPPGLISMTYVKSTATDAKSSGSLVVASHSAEVTGLLLLHTVPLTLAQKCESLTALEPGHNLPSQTQYLPSPASSLDFDHETAALLLSFKSGCVRLYDPKTQSWLLTLHTPFPKPSSIDHALAQSQSTRKSVLAAKFVLGGSALLTLLSDGEWGIWDLTGTGPSSSSPSKALLGPGTINGGGVTPFSVSGYIDGPSVKSSHKSSLLGANSQNKYAPMTPGIRRTVDVGAALGKGGILGNAARGGIDVQTLKRHNLAEKQDSSIAMWVEEALVLIPSLRTYWEGQKRKGGSLFMPGGGATSRMQRIEGVNLRGEKCMGLAQSGADGDDGNEILVMGEHRLVVVGELPEVREQKRFLVGRVGRNKAHEEDDQVVLGDLGELERSLDSLEERRSVSMGF